MPLKSLTAQANSLKGMYGPTRAAHMPATLFCHLFTDDPDDGGTELTSAGGYVAASRPSDDFPAPDAQAELTSPDFTWTSTGAWSDVATYAELRDSTGVRYDGGPLPQRINVTTAGVVVTVNARIFYNELGA